jgi:hypothetical protein
MCIYITNEMQLIQCSLLLSALSEFFGRFLRPSSGAYKTVCAALGIVGLEQPTHASGKQQESMTIHKAAHTVL